MPQKPDFLQKTPKSGNPRSKGKSNTEFNSFVNPIIPIGFRTKAQSIHKIEPSSLLSKKYFTEIFSVFQDWLKCHIVEDCQVVFCAHNGFGFDLSH